MSKPVQTASQALPHNRKHRGLLILTAAALALLLASCTAVLPATPAKKDAEPEIVTSIYALNFIANEVVGRDGSVTSLVPPGADAHHSEISLRQLRRLQEADLLIYLADFQPAVDQALRTNPPKNVLNVAQAIELKTYAGHDDDSDDHDSSGDHDDHDHGIYDPHFWLDPTHLATVAEALGEQLAVLNPEKASQYTQRATGLSDQLHELDSRFKTVLAHCRTDTLVVSHAAFGYLTDPLGITQIGIAGLDPDSEPSLARIREIRDIVSEYDVNTIFYESPTNPFVAQKVSDTLGLKTAFLDPLEIQNHPDQDYMNVMDQNLTALQTALECN